MPVQKFKKLLIANRGEIATCISSAASELMVSLPQLFIPTKISIRQEHRYKADESYQTGPDTEPLKPYLDIEEIIKVAKLNGVDAIHPGYGFPSENVNFAKVVLRRG